MADQKLTDLTALPSDIAAGDLFYVVRSGVDYQANANLLGGAALLDVGTTAGTVAAGDDSRIVAGGTALQPNGSAASLTNFPTLNQNTTGTAAGLSATLVPSKGGTGVANNDASTLTISGNFATTLTVTGATGVTLPTTGTLATTAQLTANPVTAAAVLADNALVLGDGGSRGVKASTLTADFVKATSGVPAAVAIDGTSAEVVLGRSTASSGAPELLATTGTRGSAVVLATSPTLVTPALGTPSSGTLTNCTGLPQAGTVGLTTTDSPQFAAVNLGHATDTTVGRAAAGVVAIEGVAVLGGAEATVASATTTDLGAVNSEHVSITGTTTITGFGTVAAGTSRKGRFTGALTLTHNATSLILPGGANITTAAGDRFYAVSLGSGNWCVYSYTKADGTAIVGGGGGAQCARYISNGAVSMAASAVYYVGWNPAIANNATNTRWVVFVPRSMTVTGFWIRFAYNVAGGSAGHQLTVELVKNAGTSPVSLGSASSAATNALANTLVQVTGLSASLTTSDTYHLVLTAPAGMTSITSMGFEWGVEYT